MAGLWKDVLQRPVNRSQIFTTPVKLLVIAILSFTCRLMDTIGVEASVTDFGLDSADKPLIFQNATDQPPPEADVREEGEENVILSSVQS